MEKEFGKIYKGETDDYGENKIDFIGRGRTYGFVHEDKNASQEHGYLQVGAIENMGRSRGNTGAFQ